MGAELVTNKLKKDFSDALQYGDKGAMDEALRALDALNAGIGGADATNMQYNMGLLNFDPSAVYSFGDVESNPYLYQAYQNMASKDLKPSQYKNYMNTIGAFGHMAPPASGSGGGGGWMVTATAAVAEVTAEVATIITPACKDSLDKEDE
jgi:hypothetical protein